MKRAQVQVYGREKTVKGWAGDNLAVSKEPDGNYRITHIVSGKYAVQFSRLVEARAFVKEADGWPEWPKIDKEGAVTSTSKNTFWPDLGKKVADLKTKVFEDTKI